MATFLTHQKRRDMTAGEQRFYDLLAEYLNDDYHIWYNLPLQGKTRRYPDYLIFHPQHGLLSIEIKDWKMKALKALRGNNRLALDFGAGEVLQENPIEQARNSLFPLIQKMQKDPLLQQESGLHKGKLIIPWGFGAVMSNWEYRKITDSSREVLEMLFPRKTTFYKEDILEGGLDRDGFIDRLHGLFPYRFDYPLSFEQAARIRAHIFPEFIVGGNQQIFADVEDPIDVVIPNKVQIMDNRQEQAARRLGTGHRVFHGVAGSGKTLLLIHRARKLAQEDPDKPVLVLCFNKSLAAWLRQSLSVPKVEVVHYHGWCKQMRDMYHISIPHGQDNYADRLTAAITQAVDDGRIPKGQYSAVLIDEGHDFAEDWLRTAVSQAAGEGSDRQRLLLLYDDAQGIYGNRQGKNGLGFSLSSVNIAAQGRTVIFRKNYRNSREILHYAAQFLAAHLEPHASDDNGIPLLIPESDGMETGTLPCFENFQSVTAENEGIFETVQSWLDEGTPPGNIALLCYSLARGRQLITLLQAQGIPVQDLIDNKKRESYRRSAEQLTVCSMHSSKGLEFERVIVAQTEALNTDAEALPQSARLLYVAMTRAKNHLVVTAAGETLITRQLDKLAATA